MSENTEQKRILNLYGLFAAAMVLSILPYAGAAGLSLVFFLLLMILAYAARNKASDAEGLQANHATFLIRTLWISAFFSLATTLAASFYMLSGIDYTPFQPCANELAALGIEAIEKAGPMEVFPYVEPCTHDFVGANKTVLSNALVIAALPVVIYMGYRFFKGVMRAKDGYRLANPYSWF